MTQQLQLTPDSFRVGHIAALQPQSAASDLSEPVLSTEDPVIVHNMLNLVRLWSQTRQDLPNDFHERVQITEIARQPLAIATVDAQKVTRRLSAVHEPWPPESSLNAARWSTEDLFALAPLETMEFPPQRTHTSTALDGQEETLECDNCTGEGHNECIDCHGSGTLACPVCGGGKLMRCSTCDGSGAVLRSGGQALVGCTSCGAQGTLQCVHCNPMGQVGCAQCRGSGRVQCRTCEGHGNLKRRWVLETETLTEHRSHLSLPEDWPLVKAELVADGHTISAVQWPWPAQQQPETPLEQVVTSKLVRPVQQIITTLLQSVPAQDHTQVRMSGMRVQLSGTYLFRVSIDYKGMQGTLFVGGNSSRVFAQSLPTRKQGLLSGIKRFALRAASIVDPQYRLGPDPEYFKLVREGRGHISDYRCTVPALRGEPGIQLEVTAAGYDVTLQKDGHASIVFEVELDVDLRRRPMLVTRYRMGPARRDRFPNALAMARKMFFGRIGLEVDPVTRDETFLIIDRRPYDTTSAFDLWCVLTELAGEVRKITASRALS